MAGSESRASGKSKKIQLYLEFFSQQSNGDQRTFLSYWNKLIPKGLDIGTLEADLGEEILQISGRMKGRWIFFKFELHLTSFQGSLDRKIPAEPWFYNQKG